MTPAVVMGQEQTVKARVKIEPPSLRSYGMADFIINPLSPPSALPCPRCGVIAVPAVRPGAGPHHARLVCRQCVRLLRWLPTPRPVAQEGRV